MTDQLLDYIYCYANGVKVNNVVKKGDAVTVHVFYMTDINLGQIRVGLQVTGQPETKSQPANRVPGVGEFVFYWTEGHDPGTYYLTTNLYSVDVEGEMLVDTHTYTYTVQGAVPTADNITKIEQYMGGAKLNGIVKQGSTVQFKVYVAIKGSGGQYNVSLQRAGATEVKGAPGNRVAGTYAVVFQVTVDYPVGTYVFTARLYDIPVGGAATLVHSMNFTQTVTTTEPPPPPPPITIPVWVYYAGAGIAAVAIVAFALKSRRKR